jgi:1-deoxy-D-xylulose-5-phosphate reductoisomerase
MNLYLLGATGSIGTQTLDIVRQEPEFQIVSVTTHKKIQQIKQIIDEFHPKFVSVGSEEDMKSLMTLYPKIQFGYGREGLIQAATYGAEEDGIVVNAVVGSAGLAPTIAAIKHKRTIALANKETLVIGGELIRPLLDQYQVTLLPIDSEHSAIMQCLNGEQKESIKRIIITASGGSFRELSRDELETVTVEDALKHPNWSMGAKITIDSATMMNKGLEMIEAHYLFDLPYDQIDTVMHKESIIHSLVEFHDQSMIAHLGMPDMRVPISYALHYPNRAPYNGTPLDLIAVGSLHFEPLSEKRYPMLSYARDAGMRGGYAPTVLNAANEAAVQLFLEGRISFLQIEEIVLQCSKQFVFDEPLILERIMDIDIQVKHYVSTHTW